MMHAGTAAHLDQFGVLDFASKYLEEGGLPRARGPQHETHAPLHPTTPVFLSPAS